MVRRWLASGRWSWLGKVVAEQAVGMTEERVQSAGDGDGWCVSCDASAIRLNNLPRVIWHTDGLHVNCLGHA